MTGKEIAEICAKQGENCTGCVFDNPATSHICSAVITDIEEREYPGGILEVLEKEYGDPAGGASDG